MNVYDFDKTLYQGDSTVNFYLFSLRKNPLLLRYLPKQCLSLTKYILGFIPKKEWKENFFSFLKGIKDIDSYLDAFWKKESKHLRKELTERISSSDYIISASPTFLLQPVLKEINQPNLIATNMNKTTGTITGENCYGMQKVTEFLAKETEGKIDTFYSDSFSDTPLKELAQNAFIVKKEKMIAWDSYQKSKTELFLENFFSKQFLLFLFVGCINTFNGILFSMLFNAFADPNTAFVLGYLLSLCISYLLNSRITFQDKTLSFMKFIKFAIAYIPNFMIQNLCVVIIYNILHWDKLIAYTLAAIIGIPITFLLTKFFVFTRKKKKYET
ncbi:MAG: HAD-IB family phosphatase [Clostridia bacterium]|nr:HAD-IB family phosphatase [Clostridia bacterium]